MEKCRKKSFWLIAALGLALLLVIPCVCVIQDPVIAEAAAPKLNKKKISVKEGKTATLTVSNATSKVKWSSSSKVVQITKQSGSKRKKATIKGLKNGTAKITAKVGKKKLVCNVTVKHVHKWRGYATCTQPDVCVGCGATKGYALGHNWLPANCQRPNTCQRCGVKEGGLADHQFSNGFCSVCNLRKLDDFLTLYIPQQSIGDGQLLFVCVRNKYANYLQICESDSSGIGRAVAYDGSGRQIVPLGICSRSGQFYPNLQFGSDEGTDEYMFYFCALDQSVFTFPASGSISFNLWYTNEKYQVNVKYSSLETSNFTYTKIN